MSAQDTFRRSLKDLKRSVKRAVESARDNAQEENAHTINIAHRPNVVVVKNVGGEGVASASTKQSAHIRQNGTETYEQTETTSTFTEQERSNG